MISQRILAALVLLCALPSFAYAQKTKAALNSEVQAQFPDNSVGAILPLNLRAVTSDIVNSILPTAPVVSGNLPCFNGTTGLLQDCGLPPVSGSLGSNVYTATKFGMVGDGVTDNAAAFNAMLTTLSAQGGGTVIFGCGENYSFSSKPNAIGFPIRLQGCIYGGSSFIRNYSPGTVDEAFLKTTFGYIEVDGIDFAAGDGTSGGRGLEVIPTTSPNTFGDWGVFTGDRWLSNIHGAGTGTWKYAVYLDGSNSPNAPGAPGLRDWTFINCWIFNTTSGPLFGNNVRQFGWYGGGWFSGSGVNTMLQITGASGSGNISENVYLAPISGGGVTIDNTTNLYISGTFGNASSTNTIASTVTNYNIQVTDTDTWTISSASGVFSQNGTINAGAAVTVDGCTNSSSVFCTGGSAIINGPALTVVTSANAPTALTVSNTGSGTSTETDINMLGGASSQVEWRLVYNSGSPFMQFFSASVPGGMFSDFASHTWRNQGATTVYASLGSGGYQLDVGSLGYGTGAGVGGAVTQATNRTTGVTLNKATGAITLVSAAGSATPATFTVTNSIVAATDTVIVNQKSGTDKYEIFVTAVGAGSFNITSFTTGGTTVEQPVFNFSVLKGSAN